MNNGAGARERPFAPPRFLIDEMLGRLSRWLRILGYDAESVVGVEDGVLLERAAREGRVLLTRDTLLMERRAIRRGEVTAVLVRGDQIVDQLRCVREELDLLRQAEPRCLVCNVRLSLLSRSEAAARVPAYVFQTQHCFRECPSCARVYWRGTHWEHMDRLLREAGYDDGVEA